MKKNIILKSIMLSTALTLLFTACDSNSTPISASDNSNKQKIEKNEDSKLQKELDDLKEQLEKMEKSGNADSELEDVKEKIEEINKQIADAMKMAIEYKNPTNHKHSNEVIKIENRGWIIVTNTDKIEDVATAETDEMEAKQSWSDANSFCKTFESMSGEKGWRLPNKMDIIALHADNNKTEINATKIFKEAIDSDIALWLDSENISVQIPKEGEANLQHKSTSQKFMFTCVKDLPETF